MQSKLKNCSGCKACENVCPIGCLKIDTTDKEYFIRKIDEEKCIKCKKCVMVCPMKKAELQAPIQAFIAWSRNRTIAKTSASGGMAATIYNYCVENNIGAGGVYFGNQHDLKYNFIETKEDIQKAVGSKYVYSDMNDIHIRIGKVLKNKKEFVFIGLPCHVSGLKNYCKEKNISIDKLYTVDIVCHGVPMPYVFKQHLQRICGNDYSKRKLNLFFRKKDNPYGLTIIENSKETYKKSRYEDSYMVAFQNGYYMESCYHCPYATDKRCSDMTIMDCSAGSDVKVKGRRIYDASEVLVNSLKGINLFKKIETQNMYVQEAMIENVIKQDPMLRYPTPRPKYYKLFQELEKKFGFRFAVNSIYGVKMKIRYLKDKYKKMT